MEAHRCNKGFFLINLTVNSKKKKKLHVEQKNYIVMRSAVEVWFQSLRMSAQASRR